MRETVPEESMSSVDVSISKGTSVVVPRDMDVEPSILIVVESVLAGMFGASYNYCYTFWWFKSIRA